MKEITIALDAMGGDRGADIVVPAAIEMLKKYPNLNLILVGQQSVINKKLQRRRAKSHDRITVVHAEEIVGMDEPPATALRFKKDSSMRVAINLVKENIDSKSISDGLDMVGCRIELDGYDCNTSKSKIKSLLLFRD